MKPKEFDELIRQKFDQNDFAYKPGRWDSLAEKLEGRAKKRNAIVWWWVPLAGMAASVAFAMGGTSLLRHGIMAPASTKTEMTLAKKYAPTTTVNDNKKIQATSSPKEVVYAAANNSGSAKASTQNKENTSDWFHVRLNNISLQPAHNGSDEFNFLAGKNKTKPINDKEAIVAKEPYSTFIPEEDAVEKTPRVTINLLGGYNSGNINTGYTLGGAVRKMLNDKVYIESDVAFTSSNNMQATQYAAIPAPAGATARSIAARTTVVTAAAGKSSTESQPLDETVSSNVNYNLYYAQVSPGLGYKVIKRMSVGLGPDFQRMLVDNRPVVSAALDRNNIQVAPVFDVGFLGKTEYAFTKRFKTVISYRKGVNNIITPSDKYINRDYLQFQLRYTIFNK